jgi:hypothetical protein
MEEGHIMGIDSSSIPARLNSLEKSVHTLDYRVGTLEDTHKETPARLTRVEIAVERLPQIEKQLTQQGSMIKGGFILTNGILIGASGLWGLFKLAPDILRFLGAR